MQPVQGYGEDKNEKMKFEDLSRSQIEHLIDEWIIGAHAERDRAILKHRLLDGLTFEQLAEKHDLSVRHTKTVVYKREQTLFKHVPG